MESVATNTNTAASSVGKCTLALVENTLGKVTQALTTSNFGNESLYVVLVITSEVCVTSATYFDQQ
jgi:hypothetical protein